MADLVISAKSLGEFARANPCPRCRWLAHHARPLPYQTFPGIFSSIDRYNKRIVHAYMDRERRLPRWLASLGHSDKYIDPPSYRTFSIRDPSTGAMLRGQADGIFRMADGSCTIVDYKTSKYTRAGSLARTQSLALSWLTSAELPPWVAPGASGRGRGRGLAVAGRGASMGAITTSRTVRSSDPQHQIPAAPAGARLASRALRTRSPSMKAASRSPCADSRTR